MACLVDWLLVLGWVATTAAVGIPLFLSGVTRGLSVVALNLVATLVLVAPVTVGLAVLESGVREATIGKRARQLIVVNVTTGQRISMKRALLRNALKIALPWTIGHAAVYGIVRTSMTGSVPPAIWVVTAIAYVLPIAYVVSLFIGSGRTPYDRISGTSVVIHTPV
ncbi:hypothetical protein GCM10023166_21100 [Paeniglutamicibacter cryotolerans]